MPASAEVPAPKMVPLRYTPWPKAPPNSHICAKPAGTTQSAARNFQPTSKVKHRDGARAIRLWLNQERSGLESERLRVYGYIGTRHDRLNGGFDGLGEAMGLCESLAAVNQHV